MNAYTCIRCGGISYSAASPERIINDACPYCGYSLGKPLGKPEIPDRPVEIAVTMHKACECAAQPKERRSHERL